MNRIIMLLIFVLIFSINLLFANSASQDTTKSAISQEITKVSDIKSFWTMAQLGGGVGYVIMGVLTIGLFSIFLKGIELLMDQYSSKPLRQASFASMNLTEIGLLAAPTNEGSSQGRHENSNFIRSKLNVRHSILGKGTEHLLSFYRAFGNASSMQQELTTFVDQQIEKFEAFRMRLHFLSDSAGALGLMGTVWGIFLTFFGGSLDSEKILNGMAVALITTLLGLIVSLIINFFSTEIYSAFTRRMEMVTEKTNELRLRLLQFDALPAFDVASVTEVDSEQPQMAEAIKTPKLTLCLINAFASDLKTGELVTEAIRFRVAEQDGIAGTEIKINLKANGAVQFAGNQNKITCITNEHGEAAVDICGGEKIGNGEIHYWLEGQETQKESLSLNVAPDLPSKIIIASGNDQSEYMGKELPESLRVKVSDRFDNPVPSAEVVFKLAIGDGKFKGGDHERDTQTDVNGFAEAKLKLGKNAGFHTVQALIKNSDNEGVEFRILSKTLNE